MNLCKFGIHDYETLNQRNMILTNLISYLETLGFTYLGYGYYKKIYYDHYTVCIEPNVPDLAEDKVCLRCSKIKSNYDLDQIILGIDNEIATQVKKAQRAEEAKEILTRSFIWTNL